MAPANARLSSLRARIHIAKKQLGLTDGEYRALLLSNTGKESSREMTQVEMVDVLADCMRLGWQPAPPVAAPAQAVDAQTAPVSRWLQRPSNWADQNKNSMYRKLYALICAHKAQGWNWGYVRGTAKKMFQAENGGTVVLEWLTGAQLHSLVSALQIASNRIQGRS